MKNIKLEHINRETKLEHIVEYLESIILDRFPDKELTAYEQGRGAGKVEILNMLKSRIKDKDK